MSDIYEADELVSKRLNELLHNTITVDGLPIPYWVDGYSTADYGIWMESYTGESDDSKHHFTEEARVNIEAFGRGTTSDFVSKIAQGVRRTLKASVNGKFTLNDLEVVITSTPSLMTATTIENGETVHRAVIGLQLRITEKN